MTVFARAWFEDEPRDLRRWALAGAVVVAIHAGLVATYLLWAPEPDEIGDDSPVVTVDLAPIESTADAKQLDVAPAPEEMIEQKATPVQPEKRPDLPKVVEPPPPEDNTADVTLPQQKPPEKAEEPRPPAPRTTAPVKSGAPRVEPSWQSRLVRQLQQAKRYPPDAQAHRQEGSVLLAFSVDRGGHVLSSHIVRSSGYPELDKEVMAMLKRAEPLPSFPPSMPQAQLDLTVPIRFSLH